MTVSCVYRNYRASIEQSSMGVPRKGFLNERTCPPDSLVFCSTFACPCSCSGSCATHSQTNSCLRSRYLHGRSELHDLACARTGGDPGVHAAEPADDDL